MALCFNASSGLLREQPDESRGEARFFDDAGAPLPPLQKTLELLQASVASLMLTQGAADALDAAGLLEPWPQLQGLFRINEAGLRALDGAQLQSLRDAHGLPLAYAQLLSQARMRWLQELQAQRQAADRQPPAAAPDLGLAQALFEPGQTDVLKFNW